MDEAILSGNASAARILLLPSLPFLHVFIGDHSISSVCPGSHALRATRA